MRRKKRESLHLIGECQRRSPGNAQPVKGAGAATDLVHEDQAALSGIMENIGGLGHFDHKRRTAAREIIGRTYPCKDAIQTGQGNRLRGHKRTDMGEQRDQCVLPHVGGLTAHIGACDQQHPPAVIKLCVVGNKRDIPHRFHHWVTTSFNLQQGLIGKAGPAEIKYRRPLCKATEHIKITQRGGGRLQRG